MCQKQQQYVSVLDFAGNQDIVPAQLDALVLLGVKNSDEVLVGDERSVLECTLTKDVASEGVVGCLVALQHLKTMQGFVLFTKRLTLSKSNYAI